MVRITAFIIMLSFKWLYVFYNSFFESLTPHFILKGISFREKHLSKSMEIL